MQMIKYIELIFIVIISTYIGIYKSKLFSNRVRDLEEFRNALYILKSKINFTQETIAEIFEEISKSVKPNIANFFVNSNEFMKDENISIAWQKSTNISKKETCFNNRDVEVILNLSKMIGNTDLEGQINIINLTVELLETQILEAREEEQKNVKLYKKLGTGVGLAIAIILI